MFRSFVVASRSFVALLVHHTIVFAHSSKYRIIPLRFCIAPGASSGLFNRWCFTVSRARARYVRRTTRAQGSLLLLRSPIVIVSSTGAALCLVVSPHFDYQLAIRCCLHSFAMRSRCCLRSTVYDRLRCFRRRYSIIMRNSVRRVLHT